MKYIIDEEELKEMLNQYLLSSADNIEDDVYELLIDKQPIEMIADGIISYDKDMTAWVSTNTGKIDPKPMFKKYDGKNIKIYIEEEKE